jgi:hypothetical protein
MALYPKWFGRGSDRQTNDSWPNHSGYTALHYADIITTLQKANALDQGGIRVVTCRLPLESDYQEIWQLPYTERIKGDLLLRFIQARAALGWFGQFERLGVRPEEIRIQVRDGFSDLVQLAGGQNGPELIARAREVESSIYQLVGALIPPSEDKIAAPFQTPFKLFDCLESIEITSDAASRISATQRLIPLVILDDAHFLHPGQLQAIKQWLVRREIKLGRWIMSRFDVLQPEELFDSLAAATLPGGDAIPGATKERDYIIINLQNATRTELRREFRPMARAMSSKYLRLMDVFRRNEITDLGDILPTKIDVLSRSQIQDLQEEVQTTAVRLKVGETRLKEFRDLVDSYCSGDETVTEDVRLAMLRVVLHRYGKRVPEQALLFADEGPEPSRPIKVQADIYDAACVQLLHDFKRPYFVGLDMLCDAASENAEMFLRLTSRLVDAAEVNLLKQKGPSLPAKEQQRILHERATEIVNEWNFNLAPKFKRVAKKIADRCLERTKEKNAPLGAGANAYGVYKEEFVTIGKIHPELAQVIKFALANTALLLVSNYACKKRNWVLLELSGPLAIYYGLPLKRGGFVEGTLKELADEISTL